MANQEDDIQQELFRRVAGLLPSHVSMVIELSSLLDISTDSAYRRLRGETVLSLAEAQTICRHFGIGLGEFGGGGDQHIVFRRDQLEGESGDLDLRFERVLQTLTQLQKTKDTEIVYFSMELPVFHLMQSVPLLAFKLYYWEWIDLEKPTEKGALRLDPPADAEQYARIANLYTRIPSTEIIYEEALSTTMQQIIFFLESGSFARPEDALILFGEMHRLVDHLRKEATLGRKFLLGAETPAASVESNFRLFYNEMVFSQNLACLQSDSIKAVFLENNVLDFLYTNDPQFYRRTRNMLDKVMRKSVLISQTSERERNKFFNRLDQSIKRMSRRAEAILNGD